MKKISTYLLVILTIISCQNQKSQKEENIVVKMTPPRDSIAPKSEIIDSTDFAKKWLIQAIETTFKTNEGDMKGICTPQYEAFKTDAIGVDMDGGMTPAEFKKKWSKKYNIALAGASVGFMISGQDWQNIKVSKCELQNKTTDGAYVFNCIIDDIGPNVKYKRNVTVIPNNKSFLISNVLEYN